MCLVSLVLCFDPLKRKIAGSQITLKLFLICSDDGKNDPFADEMGDEKPGLCSFAETNSLEKEIPFLRGYI